MGIEKITEKILAEAKVEAQGILDGAKATAENILKDAREYANQTTEDAEKQGRIEKEKVINQKKSVADIDSRMMILEKKQEFLGKCFNKAQDQLLEMEEDKYIDFLTKTVLASGIEKGSIQLNKKDKESLGDKLLSNLTKVAPTLDFSIEEECGTFAGGLLIKSGKLIINGTVESFVSKAKEEMSYEVAQILFQ